MIGIRRQHRGLRFRLSFTFAVGGLVLSAVFASLTYFLVETYLVREREAVALRQSYANARLVRESMRTPNVDPSVALSDLDAPANAPVLVRQNGRWFGLNAGFGPEELPPELRALVDSGQPARQRVNVLGGPQFVVGVPIAGANAQFYEVFSLAELESTLRILRWSLLGGALLVSAAAALMGLWVARRVLSPVHDVSEAAASIAGGDLSTRLDAPADRDLAVLATSFNTMVDALEARIERDARFSSDVSHELRSPLTTLATSAQVLQARRDSLAERDRVALDLLVAEIDRFQRLVADLLELGRTDAGAQRIHLEPVRLGELVLHSVAGSADPSYTVEIDPDVASTALLLDKHRVDRVLTNVLENARTHGRGITGVSASREDDVVRLEVCDSGPGVPADERQAVFERFFRGAASGRRGTTSGSGIGLALVAEHVRALDGRVWVEDGPGGRGARFVITLPWRPA